MHWENLTTVSNTKTTALLFINLLFIHIELRYAILSMQGYVTQKGWDSIDDLKLL